MIEGCGFLSLLVSFTIKSRAHSGRIQVIEKPLKKE